MHLVIPARRGAVPAARHWVLGVATRAGLDAELVAVVNLLTSELVANAVLHGAGRDVDIRVGVGDGLFTVAVSDTGDRLPVVRTTGPEVPGGQGMRLIDMLATRWGVDPRPTGGKTVWFTLAVHATP